MIRHDQEVCQKGTIFLLSLPIQQKSSNSVIHVYTSTNFLLVPHIFKMTSHQHTDFFFKSRGKNDDTNTSVVTSSKSK